MKPGNDRPLVLLVGARGFIGQLHAKIYRAMNVRFVEVDLVAPTLTAKQLRGLPWSEVVVDVCTPTAVHTDSLRWGYAYGARRFFVEKPAAVNYVDWRSCMIDVPDALIFVGHSYIFSQAFRMMMEACPQPVAMTAAFDKDRAADDLRLRGADPQGRLADIFQIELVHAFAMVLAVQPALALSSAAYTRYGERVAGSLEPTAAEARFGHETLRQVLVTSDLRAPRRRLLELRGVDGERVTGCFPLAASSPEASVEHVDANGRATTLLAGRDDLLRATLTAALDAMRAGVVPWPASAHFAALVLARIAEARRVAAAAAEPEHRSEAPAGGRRLAPEGFRARSA